MLFNSFEYLLFLPIVFLLYWFVFNKLKVQNMLVVVASYIFYGWWDKTFLLLIAFTTFCSYLSGVAIESVRVRHAGWGGVERWIAAANIIINLTILGVYKYFNFFADSLSEAFAKFGYELHPITLQLVLPVGISFYTFQALSYTIDVYRRKMEPTHNVVAFFAFISFFPQLVAGPIERATNLLPQFLRKREFDYTKAVDGTRQILWGLFKKMVIADNCADVVDKIWGDYTNYNSVSLIIAAILFAFQIYGDFSGYSDIAIGTAKLFGIQLMRNFNVPYFSRNIAEFWRRWHISLNTWFVDYVYIPLGGSREGKWKAVRNTFVIFFLSGLWHGANWTYVSWGVYHACCFLPLLLIGKNRKYRDTVAEGKLLPSGRECLMMLSTFAVVTLGWVIFRANSMHAFFDFCTHIITNIHADMAEGVKKPFPYIALLLCVEWINRCKEHPFRFTLRYRPLQWGLYLVLFLLCLTKAGAQVQFIYFQF